ncbi:hypothetical protein Lalb_Chr18g0057091 [Lupinus albus]|uniref:Uncharacterized protein n=1 Tax=Lupinus albus TaxID=3870 RepID=A0A6A4NZI1_LUPAL|nr:hypothetical protein Lalb_Chr18g0057091 [Lupinus albus]
MFYFMFHVPQSECYFITICDHFESGNEITKDLTLCVYISLILNIDTFIAKFGYTHHILLALCIYS